MYPIHRWQAFARLTADEHETLVTLGKTEVNRQPGETIRSEGADVSGLYLLISGWVASSIVLRTGTRLIQKVHLPGDMLGTPSMVLPGAADTLTAITESKVAFVPFERIGAIYARLPRLAALITYAVQAERLALMDALAAALSKQLHWAHPMRVYAPFVCPSAGEQLCSQNQAEQVRSTDSTTGVPHYP